MSSNNIRFFTPIVNKRCEQQINLTGLQLLYRYEPYIYACIVRKYILLYLNSQYNILFKLRNPPQVDITVLNYYNKYNKWPNTASCRLPVNGASDGNLTHNIPV